MKNESNLELILYGGEVPLSIFDPISGKKKILIEDYDIIHKAFPFENNILYLCQKKNKNKLIIFNPKTKEKNLIKSDYFEWIFPWEDKILYTRDNIIGILDPKKREEIELINETGTINSVVPLNRKNFGYLTKSKRKKRVSDYYMREWKKINLPQDLLLYGGNIKITGNKYAIVVLDHRKGEYEIITNEYPINSIFPFEDKILLSTNFSISIFNPKKWSEEKLIEDIIKMALPLESKILLVKNKELVIFDYKKNVKKTLIEEDKSINTAFPLDKKNFGYLLYSIN